MPRIEDWGLYTLRPHDGSRYALHGRIFDRTGFPDGELGDTSEVIAFLPSEGEAITRNSVYDLGAVSPDFVAFLQTLGQTLDSLAFDNREKTHTP